MLLTSYRLSSSVLITGHLVEGMFKGAPILLLTTAGVRSGKTRVNPLSTHT
jgi:hypothetical protein